MAARFKIGDRVYTTGALDEVPLRDLIRFNGEAADMGLHERWNDVERIAGELDAMTPEQAEGHPDKLLLIAVTIWVSRRLAGEDLTFGDAIDVPMKSLAFLPDPEDNKPKANPTKRPKRPASEVADVQDEPAGGE